MLSPWFTKLFLFAFLAVGACARHAPRQTSLLESPAASGHLPTNHPLLKWKRFDAQDSDQVHVSLAGPNQVFVVYATSDADEESIVFYGNSKNDLKLEMRGTKKTYTQQICPAPAQRTNRMPGPSSRMPSLESTMALQNTSAWLPESSEDYTVIRNEEDLAKGCWPYFNENSFYESPTIHTVHLTQLLPSTRYYYRCGRKSTRVFSFRTPPEVGPTANLRLGVWADVGQSNVSILTAQGMIDQDTDLSLLAGDLSYADGTPWRWDTWATAMEPLMANQLHLFCPGNHDLAEGAEQGVAYSARYPSPSESSGSTSPLWYSVDIGPVHLVSLAGQYSPIWPGSAQYAWLLEDLAQVNRTVTPWLVAVWHTPWYSSNENHKLEAEPMRRRLERLMYDAGVNVVINGHVHAYERTHPVFEFERDECAPTYLVVGDAGNYEGPATPWADPKPVWSAFRQASFGTGVLEFQGSEKAVWTWRRRACVRLHGGMFDVWTHLNNATYFVPFTTKDGICETEDDNSQTSSLRLDSTVIHQHPNRCKRSRNSFVSRTNPSNLQTF